jgi:hypothetical protein
MVKVGVGKRQLQFLLDTGATTTLLNRTRFSSPEWTEIMVDGWNGATAVGAQQVLVHNLTIGEHSLANLKLLALDLTSLELSCQKRVDGVLGVDLIAKLGLIIDLKNQVAVLKAGAKSPEAQFSQFDRLQAACAQAFNRSDEKTVEQCLDPDMLLLTSEGDYRGRKAVMKHFKESYFAQDPPALISLTPRARHAIDTVIWIEYEMSLTVRGQAWKARGTALYRKSGERWLMSILDYAIPEHAKWTDVGIDIGAGRCEPYF